MLGFPDLSQVFNAGPWILTGLSLITLCTSGARH
jgi:hypothetical protein